MVSVLYHTKRFFAICSWISKHVDTDSQDEDDESIFISCKVTKNQLEQLASTLEQLDFHNCETIFPICNKECYPIECYDQQYWMAVHDLEIIVRVLLELFDFENKDLLFSANS